MQTTSFEEIIQVFENYENSLPRLNCVDLILIKDFVTPEQKNILESYLKSIQDTAIKQINDPNTDTGSKIKSITVFFKILELETALNSSFIL